MKMQLNEASLVTFNPPLETVLTGSKEEVSRKIAIIKKTLLRMHNPTDEMKDTQDEFPFPHNAKFERILPNDQLHLPIDSHEVMMTITDARVYFSFYFSTNRISQVSSNLRLIGTNSPEIVFNGRLHRPEVNINLQDEDILAQYICRIPLRKYRTAREKQRERELKQKHGIASFYTIQDVYNRLHKRVSAIAKKMLEETIADVQGRLIQIIKTGSKQQAKKLFKKWTGLNDLKDEIENENVTVGALANDAIRYGLDMAFRYYNLRKNPDAPGITDYGITYLDDSSATLEQRAVLDFILEGNTQGIPTVIWFAKQFLLRASEGTVRGWTTSSDNDERY